MVDSHVELKFFCCMRGNPLGVFFIAKLGSNTLLLAAG